MKYEKLFLLLIVINTSKIFSNNLNLALSAIVTGIIFYQSQKYKENAINTLVSLKTNLRDSLSSIADTLENKLPKIKAIFKKAYDKKLQKEGKWFPKRWYKTRQFASEVESETKGAIDALNEGALEFNELNRAHIRSFVENNYIYARIFCSVFGFYLTNKILNKFNK